MNIQHKQYVKALVALSQDWSNNSEPWQEAKLRAINENGWFTEKSIDQAQDAIIKQFLDENLILQWLEQYPQKAVNATVGLICAGNIPMVGFHDMLCCFVSGATTQIKLSSKDYSLMAYAINFLNKKIDKNQLNIVDQLKNCDAYIATGSGNTSRYFEQYFGTKPNIIRKNRTSVAILDGSETKEELEKLCEDFFQYFGLGCRNVTQVYVPKDYDFQELLQIMEQRKDLLNHHKYKNNFDYHTAIYLLNKVPYLTNDMAIIVENEQPFSAVSVIHYQRYDQKEKIELMLMKDDNIQAVIGHGHIPFGDAQSPNLTQYADGVDTMAFLHQLD